MGLGGGWFWRQCPSRKDQREKLGLATYQFPGDYELGQLFTVGEKMSCYKTPSHRFSGYLGTCVSLPERPDSQYHSPKLWKEPTSPAGVSGVYSTALCWPWPACVSRGEAVCPVCGDAQPIHRQLDVWRR